MENEQRIIRIPNLGSEILEKLGVGPNRGVVLTNESPREIINMLPPMDRQKIGKKPVQIDGRGHICS
ncbi:MAG: hypothetical protein M1268_02380 [Patescibacteria group bacterium]|nr:hypothetical protein [Patescibacteria group bacterium]